jgi:hypothetical protein
MHYRIKKLCIKLVIKTDKKYVCIPRSFLVINVCNQGKTLCSPCRTEDHRQAVECRKWSQYTFVCFMCTIGFVLIYFQSKDKAMTVVRLQILIFLIIPSIITTYKIWICNLRFEWSRSIYFLFHVGCWTGIHPQKSLVKIREYLRVKT